MDDKSLPRNAGVGSQTKVLQRRLSLRLLLDWVVYTIAFIILAALLNAFVVPPIAEMVARNTSEWFYWDKKDYPLSVCLQQLDGALLAVEDLWVTAEERDAISQEVEDRSMQLVQNKDVVSTEDLAAEFSDMIPYANMDEIPPESPIYVSINGDNPEWTYIDDIQRRTILSILGIQGDDRDWQILETPTNFEIRNLHTYRIFREFKAPVVIFLYFAGCMVLVFLGYRRSLRYFDELSGAVSELLKDRTKPVELSSQLLITQYELNSIRLTSLADERAAAAAEQRKDELVAYLAHDIKTPLTSVMGYLMLLDEAPELPEDVRRRYIRIASEKTERLEELIDEFFEITRYNLHSIPIERENVSLSVLCQQVVEEFFPVCEAKGIRVDVDVPEDSTIFIDPDKVARVLGNIMRNAVAYANPGSTIELSVKKDGSSWLIRIENEGREISEHHLKSIFEKFYRADGSRSSESGRSGLGLAIAKEIVEAHGGRISATSDAGRTAFTVELPE